MGRKSNRKKQVRELDEEKKKSKVKKQTSKKKTTAKKLPKLKLDRQQVFGIVLSAVMLAILVSVGYLLFQRAFKPQSIAKFLPADNTILTLEVNSNLEHQQLAQGFGLLKNYPDFSKDGLIKMFESEFLLNYQTDIKPWLGRQIGLALVKSNKQEGGLFTYYFAEIVTPESALKFLKDKSVQSTYGNQNVYLMTDGPEVTFLGNYMVLSNQEGAIAEIIDFQSSKDDHLYATKEFRQIRNNLPVNNLAYFFLNFQKLDENAFKMILPFLYEKGIAAEIVDPLIELFSAEGMTLVALEDKFVIQSFLSLDSDSLIDSDYLGLDLKYTADLAEYASPEVIAFWGGQDLDYQLKRMIEVFASDNEQAIEVFDSILQSYTQKLFGSEVSLTMDILPLLKNEFALSLEQLNDQNVYTLLIELGDVSEDTKKVNKIADNFAKVGAVFEQKLVNYVLPDGTPSQEIVAIPKAITKEEKHYEGRTIYEMQIDNGSSGVYYTFIDELVVISNSEMGIKQTVDIANNQKESINEQAMFASLIEPVLNSSDEISYFNFEKLLPIMFNEGEIPEFLIPIAALSSGRNYFNNGVTSLNYLQIE